jgi:hypothetical protein
MKTLFYMGRNPKTKSGVSWKIWKIERHAKTVTRYWGAAEIARRKVVPRGGLQAVTTKFRSEYEAGAFVEKCVREKLAHGYQRSTRCRS